MFKNFLQEVDPQLSVKKEIKKALNKIKIYDKRSFWLLLLLEHINVVIDYTLRRGTSGNLNIVNQILSTIKRTLMVFGKTE